MDVVAAGWVDAVEAVAGSGAAAVAAVKEAVVAEGIAELEMVVS